MMMPNPHFIHVISVHVDSEDGSVVNFLLHPLPPPAVVLLSIAFSKFWVLRAIHTQIERSYVLLRPRGHASYTPASLPFRIGSYRRPYHNWSFGIPRFLGMKRNGPRPKRYPAEKEIETTTALGRAHSSSHTEGSGGRKRALASHGRASQWRTLTENVVMKKVNNEGRRNVEHRKFEHGDLHTIWLGLESLLSWVFELHRFHLQNSKSAQSFN